MKFGKLPTIEGLVFDLPVDAPQNRTVLANSPTIATPQMYIGCTGWGMKEWVGNAYPPRTKIKDYLKYYCKQFNTIELNTTHYRIPDITTIEKWKAEAEPDFKFCPKIVQSVSHRRDLGLGSGLLIEFCEVIQRLEEHLGCCFIQMPPYFGADQIGALETFLKRFPKHIPLAVEVRHESWFSAEAPQNALFDLLESEQRTAVITDVAGRRDVLHQRLTNGTAMVRFVGNDLHESDYWRIDKWVERIKGWFEAGLSEMYFFTHEPDNLNAPELADYLAKQMKEKCNVATRGPKLPYEAEGQQFSLF